MNPKDFFFHDSICPLPWTGIFVHSDGAIKNCAISQTNLGNIHDSSLENILRSEKNIEIKQDMLIGRRHERCNSCYQVEDNSNSKIRNESNRTWYKKIAIKHKFDFKIFDSPDNFSPMVLDLRWRNTCNRACIYCGPDLSSLWENIMDTEYKIDETVLDQSKKYIFDNLYQVKHVYLAGGEPLLIKENITILEKLLEINPLVEIRINSNIGNIDTPVFKLIEKFQNVKWTISVDSKDQSFEYMRWPGKWNEFVTNLKKIQDLVGNNQINFNMVWCILNDLDIFDTFKFLLDQGYHENMFVVQCLTWPKTLSVLNLPMQERTQLQQIILDRQKNLNPSYWLYKSLTSMYNFLKQPEAVGPSNFFGKINLEDGLPGTFKFLAEIDSLRGTDSSKIFSRLYQLK